MLYWVYILQSQSSGRYYCGYSSDPPEGVSLLGRCKLSTTDKGKAIGMLATGMTQQAVGDQFGIAQRTVSDLAQEHKELIQKLTLDIIKQSIPLVRSNHILTLKLAQKILKAKHSKDTVDILQTLALLGIEAKDILTLSDRKEDRALKIMGVAPAHAQSFVLNLLYQDNRIQALNPKVLQAVGRYLTDDAVDVTQDCGDTVDIEPHPDNEPCK